MALISAADYAKLPSSIAKEQQNFAYQAANPSTSSYLPQKNDPNSAAYIPPSAASSNMPSNVGLGGRSFTVGGGGGSTVGSTNYSDWQTANINNMTDDQIKAWRSKGANLSEISDPNYLKNLNQAQAAPPTALSSSTMNPATGQAYAVGQNGLNGNMGSMPGQFSGNFSQTAPTMPGAAAGAKLPAAMDAAAIKAYAQQQIAQKLAQTDANANQALAAAQTSATGSKNALNDQLSQNIARLQSAAQMAQSGVQTGYDRANAITKDNRVLSDSSFQRNTNPFSGATDYKAGLIGREREISDRQGQEDYNSRIGQIQSDSQTQQGNITQDINTRGAAIEAELNTLTNKINENKQLLRDATGAEEQRLIREITADERQYALALKGEDRADALAQSSLTNTKFQQDLAAYNANRGTFESDRAYDYQVGKDVKTDFRYEDEKNYSRAQTAGDKATAAGQQTFNNNLATAQQEQQTKNANWNAYMDSVGLTGNLGTGAKADWALLGGTDGAVTEAAKSKYLQEEGIKLNNDMAKLQLADYPAEQKLKMEQLKKQIAEIGKAPYQSVQDMEFDKIKLDTARAQLAKLEQGDRPTAESYSKNIDKVARYEKDEDGKSVLANPQQVEDTILLSGLSDYEQFKLYKQHGIPWTDPIPKP